MSHFLVFFRFFIFSNFGVLVSWHSRRCIDSMFPRSLGHPKWFLGKPVFHDFVVGSVVFLDHHFVQFIFWGWWFKPSDSTNQYAPLGCLLLSSNSLILRRLILKICHFITEGFAPYLCSAEVVSSFRLERSRASTVTSLDRWWAFTADNQQVLKFHRKYKHLSLAVELTSLDRWRILTADEPWSLTTKKHWNSIGNTSILALPWSW